MLNNASNILRLIRNYARYDLKRELLAWRKISKFYRPVTIPLLILVVAAFVYLMPSLRGENYLAIGQGGNLYEQMGDAYARYFSKHDLNLKVVNTSGLDSGLDQLDSDASHVNASFVTSGTSTADEHPDLVSLGTVEAAPLWLFYRGETVHPDDPFEYFKHRKIAIGGDGTATHRLFMTLMDLTNKGTADQPNFLHLPHTEAANRLRNGDIEAMFIVDGYRSPIIQSLLNDPSVKLMNFPLADAYVRKLPYLKKVTVPKAAIDVDSIRPAQDVTLLATSVNLLVEKDIHPATQWAYLMAAQDLNLKSERFFVSVGPYPAYEDKSFPLSPVAERFYKNGVPVFFEYLPLWLAALLDSVWVLQLAALLVILAISKKLIGVRSGASSKLLWKHFWELRYLEDLLRNANDPAATEEVLLGFQELESRVKDTWVQSQHIRHYYNLKRCIESGIVLAEQQLQQQTATTIH